MKYIQMNSSGKYRGQEYSDRTILAVSDDLANRIISNGRGSSTTKETYDKQNAEVNYKLLNKDPLIEYAEGLGVDGPLGATKDDIYELIEAL